MTAGAADLPQQGEGEQVVARLEAASRVRQGEEAKLWFNTEHLHLFDPETGKTLLGSPHGNGAGPGESPAHRAGNRRPQISAGSPAGRAARRAPPGRARPAAGLDGFAAG